MSRTSLSKSCFFCASWPTPLALLHPMRKAAKENWKTPRYYAPSCDDIGKKSCHELLSHAFINWKTVRTIYHRSIHACGRGVAPWRSRQSRSKTFSDVNRSRAPEPTRSYYRRPPYAKSILIQKPCMDKTEEDANTKLINKLSPERFCKAFLIQDGVHHQHGRS